MLPRKFHGFTSAFVLSSLLACEGTPTAPAAPLAGAEILTVTSGSGKRNAMLVVGDSVVISVAPTNGSASLESAVTWKILSGREAIGIRPLSGTTALVKTFVPGNAMIQAITPGGTGTFTVGVRVPSQVAFVWTAEAGMKLIPIPDGARDARATAVNNRGEVVGWFSSDNGNRAFFWSQATGFHAITESRQGESAEATAINNQGVVVGGLSKEWVGSFAFAWSPSEGFRLIGVEGAWAHGINDAGQVVGGVYPSNESVPVQRAFIWKLGENALTHLRDGSVATDISNSGNVVGYTEDAGQAVTGLAWPASAGAPVRIFETLDLRGCSVGSYLFWKSERGCVGEAASVNDAGEVAGTKFDTAFRWTPGNGVKLLELSGSRVSWGRGINAQGDVVGHALTSPLNAPRPIHESFVWRSNGEITKLGKLPGTATTVATAINDHGMVVGYAY